MSSPHNNNPTTTEEMIDCLRAPNRAPAAITMREQMAKAAFERMAAIMRQRYPVRDEGLITDETWETTHEEMRQNWLTAIDAALTAQSAA